MENSTPALSLTESILEIRQQGAFLKLSPGTRPPFILGHWQGWGKTHFPFAGGILFYMAESKQPWAVGRGLEEGAEGRAV